MSGAEYSFYMALVIGSASAAFIAGSSGGAVAVLMGLSAIGYALDTLLHAVRESNHAP